MRFSKLFVLLSVVLLIVAGAVNAQNDETESIKASQPAVQAVFDAFNTQDLSEIPNLLTPEFELHINMNTNPLGTGLESQIGWIGWVISVSPDWDLNIVGEAVSDDLVFTQWAGSGTHSGEAPSLLDGNTMAPTGNEIYLEGVAIFRMEDGLIAEQWLYFDNFYVSLATGQIALP